MTTNDQVLNESELTDEVESQREDDRVVATSDPEDEMSDRDLFLAAINGEMQEQTDLDGVMLAPLERGKIIRGTIASIGHSEILIDVGAKSEGVVSDREVAALDEDVKASLHVGDDIDVYVLSPEDRTGNIRLSIRKAMEEQFWNEAKDYLDNKESYNTHIVGYNKGGLIVRFGQLRGFVPASQLGADRRRRAGSSTSEDRWAEMVDEEIIVKVIEVDRGRNRLILSERAATKEVRASRRAEMMETLRVGDIHTGRVISLADFGAFVDLGGVDGLIHLSELDWTPVSHPQDVLNVGDEVTVEVISIDTERQRIGLSRKRQLANPWDTLIMQYQPDQLVQGEITKLTKFGAFARLADQPAIEGLIHISELSDQRVKHPSQVVQEGQMLTLRIISIDPQQRRIGLSLKRVDSEDYLEDDWSVVVDQANDAPSAVEEVEEDDINNNSSTSRDEDEGSS